MTVETIHQPTDAPPRMAVTFAGNDIMCRRADESVINSLECPECGPKHGAVLIAFATDLRSNLRGVFMSMTPDQARDYAAMLIEVANELDRGALQ